MFAHIPQHAPGAPSPQCAAAVRTPGPQERGHEGSVQLSLKGELVAPQRIQHRHLQAAGR